MQALAARNPVFVHKILFRAVLQMGDFEIENMTAGEYLDSQTMLRYVLKLWHAPWITE